MGLQPHKRFFFICRVMQEKEAPAQKRRRLNEAATKHVKLGCSKCRYAKLGCKTCRPKVDPPPVQVITSTSIGAALQQQFHGC